MMKLELHVVQSFAPSCLNRDDVNAPKDCEFGGVRRARISSQCVKRAIRQFWGEAGLLSENRAVRTRRLGHEVASRLVSMGHDIECARNLAQMVLEKSGFGLTKDGTTEYLLFISDQAVTSLADVINDHWDTLVEMQEAEAGQTRKKGKATLPPAVEQAAEAAFDTHKAADIAMFGRMIADAPDRNVEAACQVAHAISTHRVSAEIDFFTAVDDLQTREETGAGMMGTVEFNAACFYRYSLVDIKDLMANLGGDAGLAIEAMDAFVRASVLAIPTGRQNSMAAHNPPSFVLAVLRSSGGPWSLANAVESPVTAPGGGLVRASISRLDDYWGRMARTYGEGGLEDVVYLSTEDIELEFVSEREHSLDGLVGRLRTAVGAGIG